MSEPSKTGDKEVLELVLDGFRSFSKRAPLLHFGLRTRTPEARDAILSTASEARGRGTAQGPFRRDRGLHQALQDGIPLEMPFVSTFRMASNAERVTLAPDSTLKPGSQVRVAVGSCCTLERPFTACYRPLAPTLDPWPGHCSAESALRSCLAGRPQRLCGSRPRQGRSL